MSFSLKLLGGVALRGEPGLLTGPAAQRFRLALLALLAAAYPRAVSRDKLMAWLWPERDTEPARHLLNQAVHALRRALGPEAILSAGDDLQFNAGVVDCDVVAFEEALARGEAASAAALYAGPFLDGFHLDGAPEFERWVDRERDRLAAAYAKVVDGLAEAAERAGDAGVAVEWWRARAAHDPYDSRVALRLMQALERAGNRAGALQHAVLHQQLLRTELEIEPTPEVLALAERLRREPVPAARSREPAIRASAKTTTELVDTEATASSGAVGDHPGLSTGSSPPAPARRRTLWYVAAVAALALAVGGGMRLAARSRQPAVVTAAPTTPAVVDEIAQAVARELDRRERGDTARRLPQHRTRSIPAYELYLRGNDPALLRSDSAARRGLEYFRRAIALDSTYAAAWAGLARLTYRISSEHPDSLAKAQASAEAAVRRALALDDSLGEAHAILGVIQGRKYDYAGAERHFRQAIALEPTRGRLREWFVDFLLMVGRPGEALVQAERALQLDPMSPTATAQVARALAGNNRCEEALARLETIAALDPPLLRAAPIAAQCLARMGQWDKALALLIPNAEIEDYKSLPLLGYMYGGAGRREEALAVQARLLDRWRSGAIGAYDLAFVPAGLGDRDQAFSWLDRAIEDGSFRFVPGTGTGLPGPPFDALQQDPRMDRLRERLGLQKR
jgi:DNA-binding SARP family transcriptional activator